MFRIIAFISSCSQKCVLKLFSLVVCVPGDLRSVGHSLFLCWEIFFPTKSKNCIFNRGVVLLLNVCFLVVEFCEATHAIFCGGSIFPICFVLFRFILFFTSYIDGVTSHNALGDEADGELWHLGLISTTQRCLWGGWWCARGAGRARRI